MEVMDLFTTLMEEFNTIALPMLDIESFNHDVREIATIAQDKKELYRLLAERQDFRRQELLRMWRRSFTDIAADPGLVDKYNRVEQWANAMQVCHWKSFDSYVRYFTGFLEDEGPPVASSTLNDAVPMGAQGSREESPIKSSSPDENQQRTAGVKRPAPDADEDVHRGGSLRASKRNRADDGPSLQEIRQASSKRTATGFCEDGQHLHDGSPRASKRARTGSRSSDSVHGSEPTCDTRPQLQTEEDPAVATYWQNLTRQARDRARQAEQYIYRARRDYARYRRNRLRKPVVSNGVSVTAASDVDDNESTPPTSDLEVASPVVAEILGPKFAARLRAHRSHPQPQHSPASSWLFPEFVPEGRTRTDNSKDEVEPEVDKGLTTARVAVGPKHQHSKQVEAPQKGRAPRPLRHRRPPREHAGAAPKEQRQAPKLQPRRKPIRATPSGTSPAVVKTPQPPHRLTRQSGRNKVLYELDDRSTACVV